MMDIVQRFLNDYKKRFQCFHEAAKICAEQCETGLQQSGVRAIVTYRPKRPERLKDKVEERNAAQKYRSLENIYADIRDLAGVRIALYFPGDRGETDNFIRSRFRVGTVRQSPSEPRPYQKYKKKFTGYSATHYYVRLDKKTLPADKRHCADTPIELQVASVLMHAWAEVEHDLVYKAQYGNLSVEELAILDELNGLIIAGEIALERLQRALKARVSGSAKRFANPYQLAAFLYDAIRSGTQELKSEPFMGRTDVLLNFLRLAKLDSPTKLRKYLNQLSPDTEKTSVVEQLIDGILLDTPGLYSVYARARLQTGIPPEGGQKVTKKPPTAIRKAAGYFMSRWIPFEITIRELMHERHLEHPRKIIIPTPSTLKKLKLFTGRTLAALESIRQLRNRLVHGMEIPQKEETLLEAGRYLEQVLRRIRAGSSDRIRQVIDDTMKASPGDFYYFTL
jgi:ppGpp synthetase/RelA/SpoT-type nucleotidyltranferase